VNKAMSNNQLKTQKHSPNKKPKSKLLIIGTFILIACLMIFATQIYRTVFQPYIGYGDADMGYLEKELPESLSAGDLTHFHSKEKAFEQEAPNLPWGLSAAFDRGDGIFESLTPPQNGPVLVTTPMV